MPHRLKNITSHRLDFITIKERLIGIHLTVKKNKKNTQLLCKQIDLDLIKHMILGSTTIKQ